MPMGKSALGGGEPISSSFHPCRRFQLTSRWDSRPNTEGHASPLGLTHVADITRVFLYSSVKADINSALTDELLQACCDTCTGFRALQKKRQIPKHWIDVRRWAEGPPLLFFPIPHRNPCQRTDLVIHSPSPDAIPIPDRSDDHLFRVATRRADIQGCRPSHPRLYVDPGHIRGPVAKYRHLPRLSGRAGQQHHSVSSAG